MSVVIRCKLEVNALTTPQSYRIRFIPNNHLGSDEIAAGMAEINPALTPELAKAAISALVQTIQKELINGNHINLDNSIIFTLTFPGRVDELEGQLPPVEETLHVQIHVTANYLKNIHHKAKLAREDMTEKLPLITQAEDATLRLNDVISSTGIFQLTGKNLAFDPRLGNGECVISGTRSGRVVQTQFGPIGDSSIILIPIIPAQEDQWNNEYTLSLAVRYTENGTLRTTTYRRRLRTPLVIQGLSFETGPGILTDNATAPYVRIQEGEATASLMVRIEATVDSRTDELFLRLLDMTEHGQAGERVKITENTTYILPGFSGSALSSLTVAFDNAAQLTTMVRTQYANQVVDVLDIRMGS